MSKEEKLKSMIETIKARRNDEQYMGGPFPIYHIEFDLLTEEIDRLNNIINELEKWSEEYRFADIFKNKLQELKGSDSNECFMDKKSR